MSASSGAPIPLEGWQGSTGISGSLQSESVATFAWNRWQVSTGISGNFRAEYALDAVTWGGPDFETGAGVAVSGTTLSLAATTTAGPPYSLLPAAAKLSLARG